MLQTLIIYAALPVSAWAITTTLRDAAPRIRELF